MFRIFYLLLVVIFITSCTSSKGTLGPQNGLKSERTSLLPDGLSYDEAISVKSISEEYKYLRENCVKCKFLQQALMHKDGKSYDVLTVRNAEGKKVDYYFDITSFFGKAFK